MKKLLSLMLAVMFGFTVSAQITADAYWEDFTNIANGWGSEDWTVSSLGGDSMIYIGVGGGVTEANAWLMSPSMTFNSAAEVNAGSFSFYYSAYNLSTSAQTATLAFMVSVHVNGAKTDLATSNLSVNSDEGWKLISLNMSNLSSLFSSFPATFQIQITANSADNDGALIVDDFKIRKRADAYVVKFHPGDGSGSMPDMVSTASDGQYNFTIPTCSFTAPNGTQFAYWYTRDSESNTYGLFPNDEVGLDQDYIFYAIWGETFAVNFNSNGGNGTMTAGTGIQFVGYIVPENTFTRQGYTFTGWNTEANGSGYDYEPGDTIYNMDNQTGDLLSTSVTLYAQWEEGEGGQGGEQGGQGGEQGGQGGEQGGTTAINSAAMSSISVYPNPAHNMVRVNGASISRLELMDLTGRTVRTVESGNTVDMSGLNNGVYMLRITAAEGSAVRRIVKK